MTIADTNDLPPSTEIDPLIDAREVDRLMSQSASTRNSDPEQRALAIPLTEPGRRVKRVRWLLSEILELRRRRIEAARANAEAVRQRVTEQNERRVARRRDRITA